MAEFRDFREHGPSPWRQVATLRQGQSRHSSITLGSQTIIIGGTYGAK